MQFEISYFAWVTWSGSVGALVGDPVGAIVGAKVIGTEILHTKEYTNFSLEWD